MPIFSSFMSLSIIEPISGSLSVSFIRTFALLILDTRKSFTKQTPESSGLALSQNVQFPVVHADRVSGQSFILRLSSRHTLHRYKDIPQSVRP